MELVEIKGGEFLMGDKFKEGFKEDLEYPQVKLDVKDFAIGKYPVTNEEFLEFFKETAYITDAEKYGSSFVFHYLLDDDIKKRSRPIGDGSWWYEVPNASWRKPFGDGSSIKNKMDHPVVHISFNDALAFAKWKNLRFPTEAEWEYAARAGSQDRFYWGNDLIKDGHYMANTYQGDFPKNIKDDDGFIATAPVKSYEKNSFGLYQMSGNVYEWCINDGKIPLDQFKKHDRDFFIKSKDSKNEKALRGGSYLCSPDYCKRYRIASRNSTSPDSSICNTGFRLAKSL